MPPLAYIHENILSYFAYQRLPVSADSVDKKLKNKSGIKKKRKPKKLLPSYDVQFFISFVDSMFCI